MYVLYYHDREGVWFRELFLLLLFFMLQASRKTECVLFIHQCVPDIVFINSVLNKTVTSFVKRTVNKSLPQKAGAMAEQQRGKFWLGQGRSLAVGAAGCAMAGPGLSPRPELWGLLLPEALDWWARPSRSSFGGDLPRALLAPLLPHALYPRSPVAGAAGSRTSRRRSTRRRLAAQIWRRN